MPSLQSLKIEDSDARRDEDDTSPSSLVRRRSYGCREPWSGSSSRSNRLLRSFSDEDCSSYHTSSAPTLPSYHSAHKYRIQLRHKLRNPVQLNDIISSSTLHWYVSAVQTLLHYMIQLNMLDSFIF